MAHTILLMACFCVSASAQPVASVATSLERLDPDDAPTGRSSATIYAARGETESFQIVVRGPASGLTNVNITAPDLRSASGAVIPRTAISLFREYYVYVSQPISTWHINRPLGPGWYPDGLIPFIDPATGQAPAGGTLKAVPFSVAASKNQPIWIDVQVPRTAPAGVYTGTFTVTSSQGSANIPVSLTVWNFAIPVKPALKSNFNYWRAATNGTTFLSAQTQQVFEELLRNRLMPTSVPPSEERALIDNYGLANTALPLWSGANSGNCTMSAAPSVTTIQGLLSQHQRDMYIGMSIADEIGSCTNLYDTVKAWARNLHAAGVPNEVVMPPTPLLFDDGSGTGRSAVDDWIILPKQYDAEPSVVQQAIAKGDHVWSYNALMQDQYSPKWQVDYAPINYRIQPGFINQSLGLTGLFYWQIDNWTSDAWNNVQNVDVGGYWYRGEGMLIYPGSNAGLVGAAPSMRLKYLRDGVDDFDYIQILKNMGQSAFALQVARSVGPDWTNWTKDPAALEAARIQLGQKIDQLNGGTATPAPTGPSVSISSPASGATVSGAVTVSTAVSSSVVRVEFSVDNTYLGTAVNAPFQYSLNTANLTAGAHTLTVVAYDSAWKMAIASIPIVVGSTSGPTVKITSPASGASLTGTVTVATSTSASVVRVEFWVDGIYKGVDTAGPSFSYSISGLTAGSHTLTVVAYDALWKNQIVSIPITIH